MGSLSLEKSTFGLKSFGLGGKQIRALLLICLLPMALTLSGCSGSSNGLSLFSGKKKSQDAPPEEAPDKLYAEADAALAGRKYEEAAKKFEEVDRIHPYSKYARRSIVMAAYTYFKDGKYDKAIISASRYIKLHPGTKESALAYHIVASSYFNQVQGPRKDQGRSKKALKALQTLVRRYPDSKYAKRARNRIRIVADVLAASEMNVGRYYMKRSNYLAAINRFKTVVKSYQTTQQVEEALMRLTEAYLALGVAKEAQTAAAVLGHNFPRSKWYRDSYAILKKNGLTPKVDQGSWMSRAWTTTTTRGARS